MPLPFGGVLGMRAGGSAGLPRGRSYAGVPKTMRQQHGSSLRVGNPAFSGERGVDTDRMAANAADDAERAARQGARPSAEPGAAKSNPFVGPPEQSVDEVQEAYEKSVGALPGGTMGTKPDFSARDESYRKIDALQKEFLDEETRRRANPFAEVLGLGREKQSALMTEVNFLKERAARQEKKAYEDAMFARAQADRDVDVPGVGPHGEKLVQQYRGGVAGDTVPKEMVKSRTTSSFDSSTVDALKGTPYELPESFQMTENEDVLDPAYLHAMKVAEEAARNDERDQANNLERLRKSHEYTVDANAQSAKAHGEETRKTNAQAISAGRYEHPDPRDPNATYSAIRARSDAINAEAMRLAGIPGDTQAFSALDESVRRRHLDDAARSVDSLVTGAARPAAPKLKKGTRRTFNGKPYEFIGDENSDANERSNWRLVSDGGVKK